LYNLSLASISVTHGLQPFILAFPSSLMAWEFGHNWMPL
jgi:hypothetical protein